MRELFRTGLSGLVLRALCLLLAQSAVASDDPYRTDGLTAPDHRSRWVPANPVDAPAPVVEAIPHATEELTLAQLTDLALRNNARTRQAWANARFEAAQYGIAKSALMPQLDLVLNASRARTISNTSGVATPEQNRYGPSVSLSYVLYDFGARRAEVEAQAYRVLAANLAQNRVLQEVVLQVEQAYFRLLGVEQLVRTGNQVLKSAEATLDAARRRQQAGLATIGDVYRSETAVAQAVLNLRRAEGEVAKARGQIAIACGVPVTTPLRIQPLADEHAGVAMKETLESMLKRASADRPDMAAAESRVRAARASVSAAASAGMPSVQLRLEASRQYYTDERPFAHGNLIGLTVRIPIFDGWRDDYAVRRAEAQVKQAEAARDLLYNQTELDVWQAYYDLQTATSGIAATKALVQGATQSASVAAARYQLGVGSLLDLLTAQADETNALVQQIQSRLDWYTALARLNFALGASGHFGITP